MATNLQIVVLHGSLLLFVIAGDIRTQHHRLPLLHLCVISRKKTQVRVALCQVAVTSDKVKNVAHARDMIAKAAEGGANLVLLPVREGDEEEIGKKKIIEEKRGKVK